MARYGQESQKEGGGGGSGCGDTGGGGVGAGGDAARRGGMSGGRESGGEGGAGKEEEKGGVGSGEESIHRAFVWDWGFCKGVAMYTVEVETLGEGGEVRRVFRRCVWGKEFSCAREGALIVACLSHLTIVHELLSRRSTVPAPNRDASNIWALIAFLPYITHLVNNFAYLTLLLSRILWPPSIS